MDFQNILERLAELSEEINNDYSDDFKCLKSFIPILNIILINTTSNLF